MADEVIYKKIAQGTVLCVPVVCTLLWSIMHTLYRNLHTPLTQNAHSNNLSLKCIN